MMLICLLSSHLKSNSMLHTLHLCVVGRWAPAFCIASRFTYNWDHILCADFFKVNKINQTFTFYRKVCITRKPINSSISRRCHIKQTTKKNCTAQQYATNPPPLPLFPLVWTVRRSQMSYVFWKHWPKRGYIFGCRVCYRSNFISKAVKSFWWWMRFWT